MVPVAAGGCVDVVNTHGGQVVDTWAFAGPDGDEFLSMEHSRAALRTIRVRAGMQFVSNRRRPMVTLTADTSPGIHDMLMPPCDADRYRQLGCEGHANCRDNLHTAVRELGWSLCTTPGPLNLFQRSPVAPDHSIEFLPSPARPGDRVTLRADIDLTFVFSACPMDVMPINHGRTVDVDVVVA